MVTIQDVAKEAGVSHSTVSRVLNGNSRISEETAQRVMEAVHKLGYVFKKTPESATPTITDTLGLVTPTYFTHPFFFNVYETILTTADKMGYSLVLTKMHRYYSDQSHVDFVSVFDGKVDGIIFVGELPITQKDIEPLTEKKLPMVSLFNRMDSPHVINLISDHFIGAYKATNYLIKLGHKRIAHLMGDGTLGYCKDKLHGYMKALEDNNIAYNPYLVKVVNYSYEETYECTMDLLNAFNDLTAVFCSEDIMATAFINAAKNRGLKVPSDISVIGFDDIIPENVIVHNLPLITTVRQPRQEMAMQAVHFLVNRIHGRETPPEITFNLDLIIRNSTAKVSDESISS